MEIVTAQLNLTLVGSDKVISGYIYLVGFSN
jgi:hypothetical protein